MNKWLRWAICCVMIIVLMRSCEDTTQRICMTAIQVAERLSLNYHFIQFNKGQRNNDYQD
jgi:hypothetical protein